MIVFEIYVSNNFWFEKGKRNVIFYALSQVLRNVNILNAQGEYIVTASVRKS